jgi:Protein of unknown function (DUF3606)
MCGARKFSSHPRQRGRNAPYDQLARARNRNFLDAVTLQPPLTKQRRPQNDEWWIRVQKMKWVTCDIGHSSRIRELGKVLPSGLHSRGPPKLTAPRSFNGGGALFMRPVYAAEGVPMAKRPNKEGAPDRSRINMNEAHGVRYWTETLGCSEDELAAAVARVGNSSDAVRREVFRAWAYGTFRPGAPERWRRGRPRKRV